MATRLSLGVAAAHGLCLGLPWTPRHIDPKKTCPRSALNGVMTMHVHEIARHEHPTSGLIVIALSFC